MDDAAARSLVKWFEAAGRPLPWRGTYPRDPYRSLVAEVMLQQTQVDRVVEPYLRFVARFPTLEALAGAAEDDVTREFSGLGYYRRARLLHATAKAVVAAGSWPTSRAGLAALPGVGDYTSAALAAFAFDGADPPVDGNIERVAARFRGLALRRASSDLRREARRFAADLFAAVASPAVWEGLMELGARVCTPAAPRCGTCPLASGCAALRQGCARTIPLPRRQRVAEDERWVAVWASRADGRVLVRRVPEGALLAGLWLPPFRPLAGDRESAAEAAVKLLAPRVPLSPLTAAGTVRHGITHRRITVELFLAEVGPGIAEPLDGEAWTDPAVTDHPTSTLFDKFRHAARAAETAEYLHGTEG